MRDRTIEWFDRRFGRGWKKELAKSLGLSRVAVSIAAPGKPTYTMMQICAELLDKLPYRMWPDRFSELRKMAQNKDRKESANDSR